jgi:hypothetical protein
LPIGISFFVFHNISLRVDLTRPRSVTPTLASVFLYIISFRNWSPVLSRVPKCSLPVMFQHLGAGRLFERKIRWAEPYLYGSMAALMYLEAGPETSFIYFQF